MQKSDLTRAAVIADSTNVLGKRLLTLELVYPRIIHAEVMSYCSFARNANSSRAMTPGSVIQQVRDEGFVPMTWRRADVRGMVPKGNLSAENAERAEKIWLEAKDAAVRAAKGLSDLFVARELTNRILEPFAWMKMLVTASWPSWANFLHQRVSREAQKEVQILARSVGVAIAASRTVELAKSEWHIPFTTGAEIDPKKRLMLSVARCARISYRTPRSAEWSEQKVEEDDLRLASRLQRDAHWSPFEHQAMCWVPGEYNNGMSHAVPHELRGKFEDGWIQYRKTMSGECFTDYNLGRFANATTAVESPNNRSTVSWASFSRELCKVLEKTLNTGSSTSTTHSDSATR